MDDLFSSLSTALESHPFLKRVCCVGLAAAVALMIYYCGKVVGEVAYYVLHPLQ
jgi:hypothetical protein